MSKKISNAEIASLIENDRVHKRVYTDPAIFELEMERVWGKAWIFVAHESQVPSAGDYFATSIGKQGLIVSRHSDGEIKVLFNRCSHKGAQLVGEDQGHVSSFRCPYHGYVFDTDGTLSHIPQAEGYKDSEFCVGKANLRSVPRMQIYRGFIFASLSQQGEDLLDWMGPTISSIDNILDRSPVGEIEICGGRLRYLHDANWKILLENVSDNMHAPVTHQSAYQPARMLGANYSEDDKPLEIAMLELFGTDYDVLEEAKNMTCEHGHFYANAAITSGTNFADDSAYLQDLASVHGLEKAREILGMNRQNTIMYPSIAFKSSLQTIRLYRPLAVDRTIQETWTYRLKGAPDELFENSVRYNQMIFSPSSIAGQDDYEAYHRIQYGLQSEGADWVSQHRYLNEKTETHGGATASRGTNDLVFRNEFKAWKNYMLENQNT